MKSRLSLDFFLAGNMSYFTQCSSVFHPDRNKTESTNTLWSASLGLQTVLAKSAGFNALLSTSSFSTASDTLDCHPAFLMRDPLTGFRDFNRILRALHNCTLTREELTFHKAKQPSGNDTNRAFMSVVLL